MNLLESNKDKNSNGNENEKEEHSDDNFVHRSPSQRTHGFSGISLSSISSPPLICYSSLIDLKVKNFQSFKEK